MSGWLQAFRTLLVWCAVVAYASPVVAHGGAAGHTTPAKQGVVAPCTHHGDDHQASGHHRANTAVDTRTAAPDAPPACPGHKDGSVSCCVAMCHAALPLPDCAVPWVQPLRAASDCRILDSVSPALTTRLDRPPKPGLAPPG